MPTAANYAFNGGELSELVRSRPDQARYQSGCFKLFNMICLPQGPATRRPGMRYVTTVKEAALSNDVIVVPFVFSSQEARVMEFGAGYIRFMNGDDPIESSPGVPYEVATTYTAGELRGMRFAQSGDVVYIASINHPPAKLSRYADTNWILEDINFIPQTPTPTGVTVVNTTGLATTGERTYKYQVTAINALTGEESLPSAPVSVTCDILNKTDGNFNTISWTAATVDPLEYRVYKYEAGLYGYIGTVPNPGVTFADENIGADEDDTPPQGENPFSAVGEYPSIVFFWQQRLGWASSSTKPFTIWLSPSAQFESMSASQPPADDDAIEKTLAAAQANRIQWVAGDRTLAMGTTGNEWSVGSTDLTPLTPAGTGFTGQGSKGSEPIAALATGDSLLYVQRGGDVIREFAYSYNVDRYVAPDATILSSHLLDEKQIINWCYQSNPYSVIWVVLDDGSLIALTYVREHDVLGWHEHSTEGTIEDVCSVPGPGGYDWVYFVVRRDINGATVRYIERFDNYFVRMSDPTQAFFVDAGSTAEVSTPTTTFPALAPQLEGETVKVWADGAERAAGAVVGANGDVEIPGQPALTVSVGKGFISDLVPSRPEFANTSDGTTLGRIRKVSTGVLSLFKSMGVKVGANADSLEEVLLHEAVDPVPAPFFTGTKEVTIDTGWEDAWDITIRADSPGPMTVRSIVYQVEIAKGV